MIKKIDLEYSLGALKAKLAGKIKPSNDILAKIRNIHKGKRCFIIGNGPSLTGSDLDLLKDEITFASNRIYKIFGDTDWRPTYFAMFDEGVAEGEGVIDGVNAFDCKYKFVREQGYGIYSKLIGDNVCYIHSMYGPRYLDEPQFSENLLKGVYTIASVTYTMIQIARWMGITEIYLLGMDNRYAYTIARDGSIIKNEGVLSYFRANGEAEPDPAKAVSTWQLDVAFDYADKYSKKNGFRVFNATRGGFLESFERVNLDDILKNK